MNPINNLDKLIKKEKDIIHSEKDIVLYLFIESYFNITKNIYYYFNKSKLKDYSYEYIIKKIYKQ